MEDNKKMFVDNYDQVSRALSRFVLEHAPVGLREADKQQLHAHAHGIEDGRIYTGFEFRRLSSKQIEEGEGTQWGDLHCTLYLEVKPQWGEHLEDDEGNRWRSYRVRAETSWSSWGSTEPGLAGERLALMVEVNEFAKKILEAFPGPIYQLYRTKAEVERAKAESEAQARSGAIRKAVVENAHRMLRGQQRVAPLTDEKAPSWNGHSEVVSWTRPNGDVWKFMAKVVASGEAVIVLFSRTE